MGRALRIDYPGAWYHVMNRGGDYRPIFRYHRHFELFKSLLAEINLKYKVEVHAYCLMDNHYHLLVRTPYANLSKSMQHLSSVYTRRYNKTFKKSDGPLFRARFKSKVVDAEEYLVQLARYIHLNPLQAGMVENVESYKWSSMPAYMNLVETPPWLYKQELSSHFDVNEIENEIYNYTLEGNSAEIEKIFSCKQQEAIIGNKKFIKSIQSLKSVKQEQFEPTESRVIRPSLLDIINAVSSITCTSSANILTVKKVKNNARELVIVIAKNYYAYELAEIAALMKMNAVSSVSSSALRTVKRLKDDFELNDALIRTLELLNNRLFV